MRKNSIRERSTNMEKKLNEKVREQKAITLIALVITIIVLLILASVSIAMLTGENGILTKASTAKETNAQKTAEEQVKLAIIGSYGQDGKINLVELKENLSEISGITGVPDSITESSFPFDVTLDGQKIEVSKTGDTVTAEVKIGTTPPTYTAYNIGDEVTVGGENFYVIEASDENTSTVTLLSKYNLNTAGTAQENATSSTTACGFSSTNYWSSSFTSDPFNLNNIETSVATDAINKAKTYATAKGGNTAIGKLLTYEEANTLISSYSSMIEGSYATGGVLLYWLGSAINDTKYVYVKGSGMFTFFGREFDDYNSGFGVRPVIVVSKSLIS